MPERIYSLTTEGKPVALEETPFSTEDDLQKLIADHPYLLDGEQVRLGDARRWILVTREKGIVTREKGIAAYSGESARWSVDHLIVDQDAVPTLVEVKRGANSEIRRAIVGQMLDYAAHAAETWTADELREAFEAKTRELDVDPDDELAGLLGGDTQPDTDGFWDDVSTNLAAKRLRLLFVADAIPDELARVVEFLNAQMPNIEVLAVEIKQFQGKSARTLVPRVIGRTSAAPTRSTPKLNRQSFLAGFAGDEVRRLAARFLEIAERSGDRVYVHYGTGGVSIRVKCPLRPLHITVAWLYPQPGIGWQKTRDFSFGAPDLAHEDGLSEKLRATVDEWTTRFDKDAFAEPVFSKGVKAWAVSHDAAVRHADDLAERLGGITKELASLSP